MDSLDPRSRVGQTLRGKWTLTRLLGTGGMAAVYEAVHRNGSHVAIKMLHGTLAGDSDALRRFLREGYAANRVGHKGTVHVLDDDVSERGEPFLVMELLSGESLDARLERGPLSIDAAADVLDQLLDVLDHAHTRGIVHRDLKPGNLFLLPDQSIKVLDFGIARAPQELGGAHTLAGSILGTPAFMPPEQARGRWDEVDGRSDLFAAGATFYTLLTGAFLRSADTLNESLLLSMSEPVPPARVLCPTLPPALASVLDRALAFRRDDRFPSARVMREALREARDALGVASAETVAAPSRDARDQTLAVAARPLTPRPSVPAVAHTLGARPALADVPALAAAPPALDARTQRWAMRLIGAGLSVAAVAIAVVALSFAGDHERGAARSPSARGAPLAAASSVPTVTDEPDGAAPSSPSAIAPSAPPALPARAADAKPRPSRVERPRAPGKGATDDPLDRGRH